MQPYPEHYHLWLRKARANAKALRVIMRRWYSGQANKKTLQLLGIPQSQERHFFYSGRRLRKEHLDAIAMTEAARKREIDRFVERTVARTRRKLELWRQRRHADLTKLAFDLRSLGEKIEHLQTFDEDFMLTENRRQRLKAQREKRIIKRLIEKSSSPASPEKAIIPAFEGDALSSDFLEEFPIYETKRNSK